MRLAHVGLLAFLSPNEGLDANVIHGDGDPFAVRIVIGSAQVNIPHPQGVSVMPFVDGNKVLTKWSTSMVALRRGYC